MPSRTLLVKAISIPLSTERSSLAVYCPDCAALESNKDFVSPLLQRKYDEGKRSKDEPEGTTSLNTLSMQPSAYVP